MDNAGASKRRGRFTNTIMRVLLSLSRWLIFVPIVLFVVLLSAGTFMMPNPWFKTRPILTTLGFRTLAQVSFDAIVPFGDNTTRPRFRGPPGQDLMVTLHKYPNAFSWECLRCPPAKYNSRGFVEYEGVIVTGPIPDVFDPLSYMLELADEIGPPGNAECYPADWKNRPPHCDEKPGLFSPFFDAWTSDRRKTGGFFTRTPTLVPLGLFLHVAAILLGVMALVNEFLIAYSPWNMRCRCCAMKRWCPYPDPKKHSREDIEALPDHVWDRVRVITHSLVLAYFILPAFHGTIMPVFFVRFLEMMDKYYIKKADFGKGRTGLSMRPRQNSTYLVLLWGSALMVALALLCVFVRWRVGRPVNRHITLDDLAAIESEEGAAVGSETSATAATGQPKDVVLSRESEEFDEDATEVDGLLPSSTAPETSRPVKAAGDSTDHVQ